MARRRIVSRLTVAAALVAAVGVAVSAAQGFGQRGFGRGGRFTFRLPENPQYDGAFMFCRVMFRQNPYGDGDGWSVDYPRADINLPYRLSELTSTIASKDGAGHF